ncbi:uncharacterized protein IUM83_02717 [Phytophthora cinnamomi]|uniref:uncharacterized protein n=1 Tax=Phytophthora cinnamomi TaxID=4785 RepID=UPI003559FF2D|nr:hypothetical protein IUM83_02717 [Phytophthora cinnamomi]
MAAAWRSAAFLGLFGDPYLRATPYEAGGDPQALVGALSGLVQLLQPQAPLPADPVAFSLSVEQERVLQTTLLPQLAFCGQWAEKGAKVEDAAQFQAFLADWKAELAKLQPGQPVLVPGGYVGNSTSHSIIYVLERTADAEYSFTVCNKGPGAEMYHPCKVQGGADKIRVQPCVQVGGIPAGRFLDMAFWTLLFSLWVRKPPSEYHRVETIYDVLLPWLAGDKLLPLASEATEQRAPTDWTTAALGGVHTAQRSQLGFCKSVVEAVRYLCLRSKAFTNDEVEYAILYKLRYRLFQQVVKGLEVAENPAKGVPEGTLENALRTLSTISLQDSLQGTHTVADIDPDAVVGIYFAQSTSAASRKLTKLLTILTERLHAATKKFAVIVVSADQEQADYSALVESLPGHTWLMVPFSEMEARKQLIQTFGVRKVPQLILRGPDGAILTPMGKELVMSDPTGEFYPWTEDKIEVKKYSTTLLFFRQLMERYHYQLIDPNNQTPPTEMEALMEWFCSDTTPMADEHPEVGLTRDLVMVVKFLATMETKEVELMRRRTAHQHWQMWQLSFDDSSATHRRNFFGMRGLNQILHGTLKWEVVNFRGSDQDIADVEVEGFMERKVYFGEGPIVTSPANLGALLVKSSSNASAGSLPTVITEDDIMHLTDLPTYNGTLSAEESEYLMSYLTVPYTRIPLVASFFSSRDRVTYLFNPMLQQLFRAVLFEGGDWVSDEKSEEISHIPLRKSNLVMHEEAIQRTFDARVHHQKCEDHLGTMNGLLLNELIHAPEAIVVPLLKMLDAVKELGEASVHSADARFILFMIKLGVALRMTRTKTLKSLKLCGTPRIARAPPQQSRGTEEKPKQPGDDGFRYLGKTFSRPFDIYSEKEHPHTDEQWFVDLVGNALRLIYPPVPDDKKLPYTLFLPTDPLPANATHVRLIGLDRGSDDKEKEKIATFKEIVAYRTMQPWMKLCLYSKGYLAAHGKKLSTVRYNRPKHGVGIDNKFLIDEEEAGKLVWNCAVVGDEISGTNRGLGFLFLYECLNQQLVVRMGGDDCTRSFGDLFTRFLHLKLSRWGRETVDDGEEECAPSYAMAQLAMIIAHPDGGWPSSPCDQESVHMLSRGANLYSKMTVGTMLKHFFDFGEMEFQSKLESEDHQARVIAPIKAQFGQLHHTAEHVFKISVTSTDESKTFDASNASCSERNFLGAKNSPINPEFPLEAIDVKRFITFCDPEAEVAATLPFDLSKHPVAQTAAAKDLLNRLGDDIAINAQAVNGSKDAFITGATPMNLSSSTEQNSIAPVVESLRMLILLCEKMRTSDRKMVEEGIAMLEVLLNEIRGDIHGDAEKVVAADRFVMQRHT